MSTKHALAHRAHYYSTACMHERHGECRRKCKFCDAPCQCACHGDDQSPAGASEALVGTGVGGPITEVSK